MKERVEKKAEDRNLKKKYCSQRDLNQGPKGYENVSNNAAREPTRPLTLLMKCALRKPISRANFDSSLLSNEHFKYISFLCRLFHSPWATLNLIMNEKWNAIHRWKGMKLGFLIM